jgi:hypothetical protein
MPNLRALAESDLSTSLEGDYFLPVELVDKSGGAEYKIDNYGKTLGGQVLYDRIKIDPESGEELVVKEPIVVLRRSSLPKIPQSGEVWAVRIPETPDPSAALKTFILGQTRGAEGGAAIGFIRLYLTEAEQI